MTKVIEIPQINPNNLEDGSESKKSEKEKENQEDLFEINKMDPDKTSSKQKKNKFKLTPKKKKILFGLGGVLLLLLIFSSISGLLAYRVYRKALTVQESVQKLVDAGKSQNLPQIKSELENTKSSLNDLKATYKSIYWMKFIPYLGSFIKDGAHGLNAAGYGLEAAEIVINTIEPFSDIIGFSGEGEQAESPQETTQDRLDFVIQAIPEVIPKADELTDKVEKIQEEVDYIDPDRYPEKFVGKNVRSLVQKGKEYVKLSAQLVKNGKPLLEQAPYILGTEGPRTYLILFQNDKELRPTGGFLTAYAIARVEKGTFAPVSSNDIYNIDARYTPVIRAPDPIIDYLKGPYLISKNYRLRDLNWSPDFGISMELFVQEAKKVGVTDIDGIIGVDTQLLVYLLDVIGPIGVPGFGDFSTEIIPECNCPQVIYELESFADVEGPVVWSQDEPGKIIFAPPNIDNRKKIIGPLMNSILANALGQPKDKLPALFEAGFKSLMEKHVLFYLLDNDAQKAVEDFGIAGKISDFDGDYLHINDANLGGRKSNLYVTQEVSQEIEVGSDGSIEKTLTITYKNAEEYDGWLNSVLPNYVRIYVPKGAEIISFDGVEDEKEPYEEFDKTVFAGFFKLRPKGVAKVTVKYKLPFKVDKEYKLFVQKQPGTHMPLYSISIGKKAEEIYLKTDKEFKFKI